MFQAFDSDGELIPAKPLLDEGLEEWLLNGPDETNRVAKRTYEYIDGEFYLEHDTGLTTLYDDRFSQRTKADLIGLFDHLRADHLM
ncbi:unnamed protein product [Somion occarium]|uniref:Uncharacterized protein n=1 Tax=Somion occarium TaxID=3059160 RepID=A0ABP1D5N2_9APHY